MLMELVRGEPINAHCRNQGSSLEQRLALFRQCAEAVSYAHAQGIIHRDLKPGNILVTGEMQVKLLDFGVAKLIGPAAGPIDTTTTAPMTLLYAAPEQIEGKAVSPATDVHALGVTLFELLTGALPWGAREGFGMAATMVAVLRDVPPLASAVAREQAAPPVSPGLLLGAPDTILSVCLAKHPQDRYAAAADLLAELERYRLGEPVSRRPARVGSIRSPGRDEAERRTLTVLFCDLVGSTPLSEALDPEEYHDVLQAYQDAAAEVIARYDGHLAQRLGDGLLVYFGYPAAHDDDAERAVRCGHELLPALARLGLPEGVAPLAARIGVHTGPVVVSPGPGAERQASGVTANLAARLQTLAAPNTLLISEATFRLVPGLFITKDLGTPELKGLSKPVRVYQVQQPSGVRSRLDAMAHLTPFVGREQEQALLLERMAEACEGRGQAVLLSAEPGMGKSRLLMVLRDRIRDQAHTWLECRASPLTRNSAWQPIVELLERGLSIQDGDDAARKRQRLEEGLDRGGVSKADVIPLLAPLLGLAVAPPYAPSQLGPELKRKRTLEALAQSTLALARQQALVIAFEDLHWADASSLDLLGELLDQLATARVLLVMTARPEFKTPWAARSHLSQATLRPMRSVQSDEIIASLSGQRPLPPAIHAAIVERAGGVPLFLEELTRSLLESGELVERDGAWQAVHGERALQIPDTLQALLMARLDRLGEARSLIQVAAVIGREVPHRLLALVADLDESELRGQLKQLTSAELLYPRGTPPATTYLFKHALIQDAAYESLLKARRRNLHGVIARYLEVHFPETAESQPELLALHFEKGGQIEPAVRHYKRAADKAAAAVSLQDAIAHAEHALRLLTSFPEGAERDRLELDLSLTEGKCRMDTLGYAEASSLERLFARAIALCGTTDDPTLLGLAFCSSWNRDYHRAEFAKVVDVAERLADLGRTTGEAWMESVGLSSVGWAEMNLGRLTESLDHCQRALSLVSAEMAPAVMRATGLDAHAMAAVPIARVQWLCGYPDRALSTARGVHERTRQSDHPRVLVQGLISLTYILLFRREPHELLEQAHAAIELSVRFGLAEWLSRAEQMLGLAQCMLGSLDGLALLRRATHARAARGTLVHSSFDWVMESEQCRLFGRYDEASSALAAASAFIERSDERYFEAECHRVKGELLLADARDGDGAATCFERALAVARAQQARSLELRAATSYARLLQRQDRLAEARKLLEPVYGWFTEGFDTPDLMDARFLLNTIQRA